MSLDKVTVTITSGDRWSSVGPIANVYVRAMQGENEVTNKTVPYTGDGMTVGFGGEVPNGDTNFIITPLDGGGAPFPGDPIVVFMHVDKQLVSVPVSATAA